MNTVPIRFLAGVAVSLFLILSIGIDLSAAQAKQPPPQDEFQKFYAKFRSVVAGRDQAALREMMPERFQWALDGQVSREQAFKNIGDMIGWPKFWQSAQNAAAKQAVRCAPPYCENRPGFILLPRHPFRWS